MALSENTNWVFDTSLTVDDIGFGASDFTVDRGAAFSGPLRGSIILPMTGPFVDMQGEGDAGVDFDTDFDIDTTVRSESSIVPGSKSCKEKRRREQLNSRFLELGSILEPGKLLKLDKAAILSAAVRMVTQLRSEAEKLKYSNENVQEKIKELKAEKNELCDEKQLLKVEKENLEMQIKALNVQTSFVPHPPVIPTSFVSAQGQAAGHKLMMPVIGYTGYPMWQLMAPADVDTSQDAESCPPVA